MWILTLGTDVDGAYQNLKTKLLADGYTVGDNLSCQRLQPVVKAISTAAQSLTNGLTASRFNYFTTVVLSDGFGGEVHEDHMVIAVSAIDAGQAITSTLTGEGRAVLRILYTGEDAPLPYL